MRHSGIVDGGIVDGGIPVCLPCQMPVIQMPLKRFLVELGTNGSYGVIR